MFLAFAAVLSLQASSPQSLAEALVEASGAPGAAVLTVTADGDISVAAAGVRVNGGEARINSDDLWHLGSNTKAMTATLAARLVEAGVIDWSTTVGEALDGVVADIHPGARRIPLESLLSHRSGLPANAGIFTSVSLSGADADRDAAADRLRYAAAILSAEPEPLGDFVYSNAGYVIAGLMLEARAGAPYEALMEREVFDPLGMDSADWGPPGVAGAADQPRGHAAGLFGLSAREPGARADNPPALNPAGRAHMSFADLGRFLHAHADRPEAFLSAESWARLHAPVSGGDYALGWGVGGDGALTHAGSNTMWLVVMTVRPDGSAAAAGVNDGRLDRVSVPVRRAVEELSADGP